MCFYALALFATDPWLDIHQRTPLCSGRHSVSNPTPASMSPDMPKRAQHLLLLGLAWLLPQAALAEAGSPTSPVDPERLETLLYQDCGSCHGMTLRGGLGPALPQDRMQALSPEALTHIIRHGIPGTAMPGWQALLSEEEARWIAEHLQTDNRLKTLDD